MADQATINRARQKLDDAIAEFLRDTNDGNAIPIDWYLFMETDDGSGERLPVFVESQTMTFWKREGIYRLLGRLGS